MAALVAAIHDYATSPRGKDVDGRDERGHDVEGFVVQFERDMR